MSEVTVLEIKGLTELMSKIGDLKKNIGPINAKLGNAVLYAPWVGSSAFQAPVHKGRWITDTQAIEFERKNIERDFNEAVDEALNGTFTKNPLEVGAEAAMLRLHGQMVKTPPPTGGTYVRTGTYVRLWITTIEKG